MNAPLQQFLFWIPRALGLLLAAFLSLFALDAFGEGHGIGGTVVALLMHLIPALLVLTALAVAWRWEAVGGLLFIGLGGFYLVLTPHRVDWWLVITGPLCLTGCLFLVAGAYRARIRRRV
jgi:hypothetical protein